MQRKIKFNVAKLIVCLFTISQALEDGWDTVDQLSYNLMKEENLEVHNTKLFRYSPGLHVRHDLDIHLVLQPHNHCDEPSQLRFLLIENENSTIFTWTQKPLVQNGEFHFQLHVNQSIPVGHYTLNTSDPCLKEMLDKTVCLCEVNVIFNPWLTSTQWDTSSNKRVRRLPPVILTKEFEDEYLKNDKGIIWGISRGPNTRLTTIPWDYAVDSLIVIVSRNRLTQLMSDEERSNCVNYSRALTRVVHEHVLYGRWNGDYSDGVEPSQWVGSAPILKQWLQSRQRVRYAQCWVFAAILTTLLRASGIPARTVTNYDSHHDRGVMLDYRGNVYIRSYDNEIQPDELLWNFHVWTEAWFERPDLGESADWNALDATPQEPSPLEPYQPYRAGPAYLPYIKDPTMKKANYDTHFIMAEVNARGICPTSGRLISAGSLVVTKFSGREQAVYYVNNYKVITNNYKILASTSKRASNSANPCQRDGGMRLNVTPTSPRVGEDFTIIVTEGNVSVEDIVIQMELRNYRGETLRFIRDFTGTQYVNVTEVEYVPYLKNASIFRFSVGVYNDAGNFVFHDQLRITLEYEQLQVEATRVSNSDNITLTLTFTNPLSIPMTGVILNVAGPNNMYVMMEQPDISANGHFRATISLHCGDDDDSDVMIPVSLDSVETQSIYGTGWSSCSRGPSNDGIMILAEISGLQMMLFCLFALFLCS